MKVHPNTVEKINVTLVDNTRYEMRSKLGNDMGVRITSAFRTAFEDGLVPCRITGVDILKKLDGKFEIKLEPQQLQRYLKITWVKI